MISTPEMLDNTGLTPHLRTVQDVRADSAFCTEWDSLIDGTHHLNLLYGSRLWFEHLSAVEPATYHVLEARGGDLMAACAVRTQPFDLKFDVFNRVLFQSRLQVASLFGFDAMPLATPAQYGSCFEMLLKALPDCDALQLGTVATDSPLFTYLSREGRSSREFTSYLPYGVRPWHSIELPSDFDAYIQPMGKKAKYNLRRDVRRLSEKLGSMKLTRVTEECDVQAWLSQAATVSAKTWQNQILGPRVQDTPAMFHKFADLARRRLLRAYVLGSEDRPVAFVVGCQFNGVFHYEETGYDPEYSEFSPGTGQLYLILEDLFQFDKPRFVNFGIGDAAYKRRFGNVQQADVAVLILRKNFANRLRAGGHQAFQTGLRLVKRLVRRGPATV